MINSQQTEFEIVNCQECGSSNLAENTHCRQCGVALKKGIAAFEIPLWIAWGTIGLIVAVIVLAILAITDEAIAKPIVGILVSLALLLSVTGTLWLIVRAFQESAVWGFVCLLSGPLAHWVFLFVHPGKAFKPVMAQVLGIVLFIAASFLRSFHP